MYKYKIYFTIKQIGKFRFYSGIIIGFIYSIVFNYLLRLVTRLTNIGEYCIVTAEKNSWQNVINYEFSNYYLYLIASTSIAFGFCYTTYLWSSKAKLNSIKLTLSNRKAHYNSIFVLYMPLLFLTRLIMFVIGINLTIEKDIGYYAFLLPLFLYFYCWNLISTMYKSKMNILIYTLPLVPLFIILVLI